MKTIALSTLAVLTASTAPALAGTYLNTEVNNGYTGSEYQGRTVDVHLGYANSYENLDYYIQGGPAWTAVADVDGSELEISAKVGGTYNLTDKIGVYGEFSGISNGDEDNNYGTKLGAKFTF